MQPHHSEVLAQLSQQMIIMISISFVLGSLCTVFILLIMDFVRRGRAEEAAESAADTDMPIED